MSLEQLRLIDSTFIESEFISKVDNTFIMLLSAIMMNDLDKVKHKISDNLYEKYSGKLRNLNENNERQMYDELNIWSTKILDVSLNDNRYVIKVLLKSRYMDYIIDKTSFSFKRGINDRRIEKDNFLTFEKNINSEKLKDAKSCPSCGANIDFNNNGKCSYCSTIFNTEKYDWILTNIEN